MAGSPDELSVEVAADGSRNGEGDKSGAAEQAFAYTPHILIFCSSCCIMIVELVAGRLIGRFLGSSLYTWTSIIGIVLAGMSVGNYLGGRMADRWKPEKFLGWLFLISSICCLLALQLNNLFADKTPLKDFSWPLRVFLSVLLIFMLPALALGTISPVVAKMALDRSQAVGRTIGSVYAWGAVGSIIGTFATGFALVHILGAKGVVISTALGLAVLGLTLGPWRVVHAIWVAALAGLLVFTQVKSAGLTPNELSVVGDLQTYVKAQETYRRGVGSKDGVQQYAQRLNGPDSLSHDAAGAETHLIAPAFASAAGEIPGGEAKPVPKSGYCFRILRGQGPNAPGGSQSYLVDDRMTLGHALLAYPVEYDTNTRHTFMVNQTGTIWRKDLGRQTAEAVKGLTEYNPDESWQPVSELREWARQHAMRLALQDGEEQWSWPTDAKWEWNETKREYEWRTGSGEKRVWFRPYPFAQDSDYQFIKVYSKASKKAGHDNIRTLALDYLIHGYVDTDDPRHLEYDYEKVYAEVARRYAALKTPQKAFFLGGGSYTFPRWVNAEWPDAYVDVAEIDPLVVEANHVALGLSREKYPILQANQTLLQQPRDSQHRNRTIVGDARIVLEMMPASEKYDLVFGDAFSDLSVPWHLTTLEFNRRIREHLTPNGAFIQNIIDDYGQGALFLAAYVETLKASGFKQVAVFCTEVKGVSKRRDTFVVAASDTEVDFSSWGPRDEEGGFEGSLLTDGNLADLSKNLRCHCPFKNLTAYLGLSNEDPHCACRILTDDNAPAENLLLPVVDSRDFKGASRPPPGTTVIFMLLGLPAMVAGTLWFLWVMWQQSWLVRTYSLACELMRVVLFVFCWQDLWASTSLLAATFLLDVPKVAFGIGGWRRGLLPLLVYLLGALMCVLGLVLATFCGFKPMEYMKGVFG